MASWWSTNNGVYKSRDLYVDARALLLHQNIRAVLVSFNQTLCSSEFYGDSRTSGFSLKVIFKENLKMVIHPVIDIQIWNINGTYMVFIYCYISQTHDVMKVCILQIKNQDNLLIVDSVIHKTYHVLNGYTPWHNHFLQNNYMSTDSPTQYKRKDMQRHSLFQRIRCHKLKNIVYK